MSGSVWVDVAIVAIALLAAFSGYRQGAAASALAFAGVLIGAVAGVLLAPLVIEQFDDPRLRLAVGLVLIVGLIVIGEVSGMILGRAARSSLHSPTVRRIDSGVGSVLQVIAILVAAWLLSFPLRGADQPRLSQAVDESRMIQAVDSVAPQWMRNLPDELTELIDSSGLKEVIGPFGATQVSNVDEPDAALADLPIVRKVRPSVIKITGVARSCGQSLEGSGFVVGRNRVMTNAHVVAGTDEVSVETARGRNLDARVVWFNPRTDVAILDVPRLGAPVLDFAPEVGATSDDAIVLGFPENGPYTVTPTRIRNVVNLKGPDIYQSAEPVEREVYTMRGLIRSGNSGGPMITSEGDVLGLVFGASQDPADDTGFSLTAAQVKKDLAAAGDRTASVSTQECVTSR